MKCTIPDIGIADCRYYRNGDCARTATCYDYRIVRNKNNPEQFSTPPPFKVCPDCDGYGVIKRVNQGYGKSSTRKCPTCHGTGHIPIWYTVEQWEEFTGRKVPDGIPVWWFDDNWDVDMYRLLSFGESKHLRNTHFIIIATESERPPKDWRPE